MRSSSLEVELRDSAVVVGGLEDDEVVAVDEVLEQHGIRAVEYGVGEEARIRQAAEGRPIAAFIYTVGNGYIELALRLGVQRDRIDTVVDYAGAKLHGVKALGTNDAGGTAALSELARLAAADELVIPIAQT